MTEGAMQKQAFDFLNVASNLRIVTSCSPYNYSTRLFDNVQLIDVASLCPWWQQSAPKLNTFKKAIMCVEEKSTALHTLKKT